MGCCSAKQEKPKHLRFNQEVPYEESLIEQTESELFGGEISRLNLLKALAEGKTRFLSNEDLMVLCRQLETPLKVYVDSQEAELLEHFRRKKSFDIKKVGLTLILVSEIDLEEKLEFLVELFDETEKGFFRKNELENIIENILEISCEILTEKENETLEFEHYLTVLQLGYPSFIEKMLDLIISDNLSIDKESLVVKMTKIQDLSYLMWSKGVRYLLLLEYRERNCLIQEGSKERVVSIGPCLKSLHSSDFISFNIRDSSFSIIEDTFEVSSDEGIPFCEELEGKLPPNFSRLLVGDKDLNYHERLLTHAHLDTLLESYMKESAHTRCLSNEVNCSEESKQVSVNYNVDTIQDEPLLYSSE